MRQKFHFDKKTGTMVPENGAPSEVLHNNEESEITQIKDTSQIQKPVFEEQANINTKAEQTSAADIVVKMKRVDTQTQIQLVDNKGIPESYLDSDTVGVMMFREIEDYDICQIVDERTGKALAYIGGYALQINFNMSELNSMERIEQCLQGITKLFRHKIMSQNISNWEETEE